MKVVEISARKNMLKLDNAGTTSWYKINDDNPTALELAKVLAVGDEVEVKFTVTNGVSVVSQLEKTDSSPAPTEEKTMEDTKAEIGTGNNFDKPAEELKVYKCATCGKIMKDDKYENCYSCNQATWKDKGSDRNSSIERQAIGKMTATTIANITTSPEGLLDLIDKVYDKYRQKVTE